MRHINNMLNLLEKGLLFLGFVSFSGVIQQGDASVDSTSYNLNTTVKNGALGGLYVTSLLRVVMDKHGKAQAIADNDYKVANEKHLYSINSAVKAVVVFYASSIDTLKTLVNKSQVQFLLYPAFTMFGLILGQRAYFAFKSGKTFDGLALSGMALSTQGATLCTAVGFDAGTKVSLLVGSGCSLLLFGKEAAHQLAETCCPAQSDDYSPMNS